MSLTQAVILERYKKHLANEFDLTIEQIETVLKDEVLLHDIAKLNPKELKLLIKASDSKFYQAFASYIELLKREWLGIFGVQWGWLSKLKPKAKPRFDVPLEIATGLTLDDICKGFCDDSTKRIIGAIRLAHHKGLSNNDLLKLIRGTKANNFADGIIAYNKRQAQTIARTGTAIVANQAKQEYINANKDDILGIKVIATLDTRTSPICRGRDGQFMPLDKAQYPPYHFNCRSNYLIVTKDYKDPAKRASMGGVVDNQTYYEWLKSQSKDVQVLALGKERAKLFDKMSAERFKQLQLDKNFEPLTLKEIERIAPEFFD